MATTERVPLSRLRIADAALALIDERGLAQLSMRKLGAELGVEAMSLYNHVDNKDDLLGAVADLLYEKILEEYGTLTGTWRDQARQMADGYVTVATAHPHAFELLLHRSPVSQGGLRFMDSVVSVFEDATDDLRTGALAFSAVANWVVGTLVQQFGADGDEPAEPEEAGFERVAAFRKEMLVGLSREERFTEGLETILDGIDARYFSGSSR